MQRVSWPQSSSAYPRSLEHLPASRFFIASEHSLVVDEVRSNPVEVDRLQDDVVVALGVDLKEN